MTTNPEPIIIEMHGVTVNTLHDVSVSVLENVNWTAHAGEFWVLAGRQKAGKTDLLMTVAGLVLPLAGEYRLFGREMRHYTEADLSERLRLGFVFASGKLFNHLTTAENISLPLRYHRNLDELEAQQEVTWLLDLLELTPMAAVSPANLSRDWQKRVALARALVLRPEVLLCDDPLGGIGFRHRQWLVSFLDQLQAGHEQFGRRPMTVIVTTEDLAPWKSSSRRFALLRDKQFIPLGAWTDVCRATDPVLNELLTMNEAKI